MERLSPVELRAPGQWQLATVTEIKRETPMVKSLRFAPGMPKSVLVVRPCPVVEVTLR